ncbi:response regulator [Microbulbifer thermotolerans]|uniref:response regulator n=1 Tax=Microbulbifer thermotolerans TaxID=252514 RepID=UPI00224A6422|nr:response regulator [Microbulbifer thermotolerans]MCX2834820.1 response regulator [Microbulbifer thermotolerans]
MEAYNRAKIQHHCSPYTMAAPTLPQPIQDLSPALRSLRSILFRFTVAPALALALILGVVFTLQQMHDRRQLLLSHGRASAEQLAELIELSGGQPAKLRMEWLHRSLLALTLEKDMVRSVQIYSSEAAAGKPLDPDTGLRLLAGVGPRPRERISARDIHGREAFIFETHESLQILQPLRGEVPSCWIAIELHRPYFLVGTYQVVLIGLLGLIVCTLAAFVWSIFLSERFAHSLARLGKIIEAIGLGQFDKRAEETDTRELNVLAQQINEMAEKLSAHQEEYKASLLQSMEDLRQSLDSMEEQNIELELAHKKALEASQIKSDFLANTSHEIRTPLNGIIGFTNLLLKTAIDELQQDYLQTILRSSENLLTTINDILDFSRIESGNLVLDHIPLDLGQLLEETLQILAPFAYEHHLELVPLIDTQLPQTLVGDPLRIKQILTNLVGNAVRSSEHGNIPVRLSVQNNKDSELMVRISVTDLGNRIDEERRRELQQLLGGKGREQGRQISSSGLGLAIARSLVERMRGSIGIDEAAGGGCTYWVHLPLLLERNRTLLVRERFPGCRILIADPNRMTRTQVAQLLKYWEVAAIELADTDTLQPAIEQMWRHDALPDAVIIDTAIADPGDTSDRGDFELFVETVQQLVDTYQCRVIVQGSPVELRRCYEQLRTRVLTFLGKPVTRDNLLRALKRVAPQQSPNQSRANGIHSIPPWRTAPRILAVDDHQANRLLVSELLRTQGVEAALAASGGEALELWQRARDQGEPFDLIFMDIQMPGMDGLEATRLIRERESESQDYSARIPIIALTAHAGAEEKARLLSAGLDDYLSKPVSETQLSHMIKRWMKILTPAAPQKQKPPSHRLVDIGKSLQLSNNSAHLARDMLKMLIKGLVADERELNRLNAAGDHRGLFELVHRIHGGCCYCGVPRLQEATKRLQEELRPLWKQKTAEINQDSVEAVVQEIRALREWASEQNLDVLFGLDDSAGEQAELPIEVPSPAPEKAATGTHPP